MIAWDGDPDAYVRFYKDAGYRAIYAPPLKPGDTDLIRATREAVAKAGLIVGEAGLGATWWRMTTRRGRRTCSSPSKQPGRCG